MNETQETVLVCKICLEKGEIHILKPKNGETNKASCAALNPSNNFYYCDKINGVTTAIQMIKVDDDLIPAEDFLAQEDRVTTEVVVAA